MVAFEDIDDVVAWLEPLDYVAFWDAVAPWTIFPDGDREHCDQVIANGVSQEIVLYSLKAMARLALTERFDLKHRVYEPVDRQYLMTTH
ncbi:MAG: hypothetical protein AAGG79_05625 [Pseudomonadota bacterium]